MEENIMEKYSEFIPKVHFELIPIKNLVSSQGYQRDLMKNHVEETADDFDVNQLNVVKISRRNGINYISNGQHTVEIVALVSGSRETPVWCMIYDELCYEQEADIYAKQMKHVKGLKPYDVFIANVEAGNLDQIMIKEVVESYGLEIGSRKLPGTICAVATLESIYQKYGVHVLNRTLRYCIGTWEGDINSFSANILNAIAKLIVTYNGIINEEQFKEKIGAVPLKILARNAKERRNGMMGYAEAMILIYNGKKKSPVGRLLINKLYEKEFIAILDEEDFTGDVPYEEDAETDNQYVSEGTLVAANS